jgi:hypothetical protein
MLNFSPDSGAHLGQTILKRERNNKNLPVI